MEGGVEKQGHTMFLMNIYCPRTERLTYTKSELTSGLAHLQKFEWGLSEKNSLCVLNLIRRKINLLQKINDNKIFNLQNK